MRAADTLPPEPQPAGRHLAADRRPTDGACVPPMHARDLARPYPTVTLEENAGYAAQLVFRHQLPALLVVDDSGSPCAVLPSAEITMDLIPRYMLEDPLLALVVGDQLDAQVRKSAAGMTVAELLPSRAAEPLMVGPECSAMEIVLAMARSHCPIALVTERQGQHVRLLGAVTVPRLLEYFLG